MSNSCPISNRQINGNLVRTYSVQVIILGALLLVTQLPLFAIILLYDFTVRALRLPSLSPIHTIGKFVITQFDIKPQMSDEAPKRFALFIGLGISLALSVLYLSNYLIIGAVLAIVLITCALLETLFNYCLGCKIYQLIQLLR